MVNLPKAVENRCFIFDR